MMKVVVADDEINVCQLICNLVDWNSFGMEIVGVAHNGVEALALVESLKPDLVVTDIRMPGYDGLEMIRKAREFNKNLDFIIISGYRHFEYAQRAIRFGVYDYLLKPIKKEELSTSLQKMQNRHAQRIERNSQEEELKIRLQNDRNKLRAGMFGSLLLKQFSLEDASMDELNRDYCFQFSPGLFQVFVVKLDFPHEPYFQDAAAVHIEKMMQRLQTLLAPECFDLQLLAVGSRTYGLLNFEEARRKAVRRQLKVALDEFLVQISVFENMALTIALGEAVEDVSQLVRSVDSAELITAQRLREGSGVLLDNCADLSAPPDTDALLSEFHKNAEPAVETLNHHQMLEVLETFRTQCLATPRLRGQDILSLVQRAFRMCLTLLSSRHIKTEGIEERVRIFALRSDLCGSEEELFALLFKELSHLLSETLETLLQTEKKPVRAAKQYIQENFSKQITLEDLAGVVGFNPSYFSTLFKKESGKNFLEFLTEVRMTHAKELLRESNMTVASICNEVGYSDLKHFSQSFKKQTGLKPNEYRKLFS